MRVFKFVSSNTVRFAGESVTFEAHTTVTFVNGGKTVNVIHTWSASPGMVVDTFHITEYWGDMADRFTVDNVADLLGVLFILGDRIA